MAGLTLYDYATLLKRRLANAESAPASQMVRAYGKALANVNARLTDLVTQIETAQAAGTPISPAWLFQQERYARLLQQIATEMDTLVTGTGATITKAQQDAVNLALQSAPQLIAAAAADAGQSNVPVEKFARLPKKELENLVGFLANGSPLTETLKKYGDKATDEAKTAIINAVATGQGARTLATDLQQILGTSLSRSLTISRTEIHRVHRETTREIYKENKDVVRGWRWYASLDGLTCFPKGTRIATRRGDVPIECVHAGDEVLTHTGAYQRVRATMCRDYAGELITVTSGAHHVTATSEHPFLVERQGETDWVEACRIRCGDTVFRRSERGAHEGNHLVVDRAIKGRVRQAKDAVAARLQPERLAFVTPTHARKAVPVCAVNLDAEIQGRNKEVNRVAPAGEDVLLGERDTKRIKAKARVPFRLCFAHIAAIAARRAEAARRLFAWRNTESLAAGEAGAFADGTAAHFRAEVSRSIRREEDLPAPHARSILRAGTRTGEGAIGGAPGVRRWHGKVLPTFGAGLCDAMRVLFAFARAIIAVASGRGAERRAAPDTGLLCARDAARRPLTLGRVPTDIGAEATTALYRAGRDVESGSALSTRKFHSHIVSHIARHRQSLVVYNLDVAHDHSYVANGFVVHNCASCVALHGSWHKMSERMSSHMNCRCTMLPALYDETEADFPTGPEWFAKQPEAMQQRIVGARGLNMINEGALTITDFAVYQQNAQWTGMWRAASIKEALDNHDGGGKAVIFTVKPANPPPLGAPKTSLAALAPPQAPPAPPPNGEAKEIARTLAKAQKGAVGDFAGTIDAIAGLKKAAVADLVGTVAAVQQQAATTAAGIAGQLAGVAKVKADAALAKQAALADLADTVGAVANKKALPPPPKPGGVEAQLQANIATLDKQVVVEQAINTLNPTAEGDAKIAALTAKRNAATASLATVTAAGGTQPEAPSAPPAAPPPLVPTKADLKKAAKLQATLDTKEQVLAQALADLAAKQATVGATWHTATAEKAAVTKAQKAVDKAKLALDAHTAATGATPPPSVVPPVVPPAPMTLDELAKAIKQEANTYLANMQEGGLSDEALLAHFETYFNSLPPGTVTSAQVNALDASMLPPLLAQITKTAFTASTSAPKPATATGAPPPSTAPVTLSAPPAQKSGTGTVPAPSSNAARGFDPLPFDPATVKIDPAKQIREGAHTKTVYTDASGKDWLWKPQPAFRAAVDKATAQLMELAGLDTPEVRVVTINGRTGSLQTMYQGARTAFRAPNNPNAKSAFDPEKLDAKDLVALQKQAVFDWLVGNNDAHEKNFIKVAGTGGKIFGIDKGQAFKFYGKDKLDYTYKPNANFAVNSVYNLMHEAYAKGKSVSLSPLDASGQGEIAAYIKKVQAISDQQIVDILTPYAEGAKTAGFLNTNSTQPNDVTAFLRAVLERKANLLSDWTGYYAKLDAERNKTLGIVAPTPQPMPAWAKGMAGATEHTTNTAGVAWGETKWPKTTVAQTLTNAEQAAIQKYTGNYYQQVNSVLRQGKTPTPAMQRDINNIDAGLAKLPVPEDVIVWRGTGIDGLGLKPSDPLAKLTTLANTTQTNKGYLSTSVGVEPAFYGKAVWMKIRVNKGAAASYIASVSNIKGERELLIGRDTPYYVHAVYFDAKLQKWIVEAELAPKGEKP